MFSPSAARTFPLLGNYFVRSCSRQGIEPQYAITRTY
ncbi:MAG: hypothetical protein [Bacteroides phage LoVEphage]|nr:MAG: hypothetical protein [Bacteroides phage LoVEphage]